MPFTIAWKTKGLADVVPLLLQRDPALAGAHNVLPAAHGQGMHHDVYLLSLQPVPGAVVLLDVVGPLGVRGGTVHVVTHCLLIFVLYSNYLEIKVSHEIPVLEKNSLSLTIDKMRISSVLANESRVEYYLDQAAYSPCVHGHGPVLHMDSLHALVLLGFTHEDANILLNSATFSDSEALTFYFYLFLLPRLSLSFKHVLGRLLLILRITLFLFFFSLLRLFRLRLWIFSFSDSVPES